MKLIDIFVANETGEGLYAFKFTHEKEDELERILNLWSNPEYLVEYFESNKDFINTAYFKGVEIDDLISKVEKEAIEIEKLLFDLTEGGFEQNGSELQNLFKPLDNMEDSLYALQKSKAVITNRLFPKPLLRIYALRIASNTYVITGGAIKLTEFMDEHDHTMRELEKLEVVKAFLKSNDLNTEENLKMFLWER